MRLLLSWADLVLMYPDDFDADAWYEVMALLLAERAPA